LALADAGRVSGGVGECSVPVRDMDWPTADLDASAKAYP